RRGARLLVFRRQRARRGERFLDAWSDVDADAAFPTIDAHAHAARVFPLALGVVPLTFGDVELARHEGVAGLVLARNRDWDRAQGFEPVDKTPFPGKRQHFENAALGAIVAVLGPSFGLRDPYRFPAAGDLRADVFRQREGPPQQLALGRAPIHGNA